MFALNQHNFLKHEIDVNPSFDAENNQRDKVARLRSIAITLSFHVLLLLLFLYLVLKPPFPPLSSSGVFLNLGMAEIGMGDIQPEGTAQQFETPSSEAASSSPQKKTNDIITQETEDAPIIAKKEEPKKNTSPIKQESKSTVKKNTTPVEAPPKPKALYPGNQSNSSTSEGTGNQSADQGKPLGDPRGTDYTGEPGLGGPGKGGAGGSPYLGMSGRKIIYFPAIIDPSQKTGRVIVNIKVDKKGNVVFAKATQKGSTTTDTYLYQLAEEAALKTKVNADEEAAEEQFGTITYNFSVK